MTQSSPIHPGPAHPGLVREFTDILTASSGPYHEAHSVVLRRRAVTTAVLLGGAGLLGFMHHAERPGHPTFYWLALALALTWAAGALLAGPMHLGSVRFRGRNERPVFTGTGVGLALGGIFVLGGLLVQQIPPLAAEVTNALRFATEENWRVVVLIVLVNAVAEEMFFRGALYSAFGRHNPLVWSTLLYVLVTLAAGNLVLGFAALVLGSVCAIERRATGGVLAPVLTHLMWGLVVVLALPPVFGL